MSTASSPRLLYFNGINGDSGEYDLPPMTGQELSILIRGQSQPENLNELRFRHRQRTQRHLGVKEGVDPKDLRQAGWGVIFAHDEDPAIIDALSTLIDHRAAQAGDHFRLYAEGDGHLANAGTGELETKQAFLARHGAGPGPADPERVPYYLLIVGSPERIPYRFQTQLDVQYAVGRIHFETPEEYANYAASVVQAESGAVKLPRQAAFWGVANPDDDATQMSADFLVQPLLDQLTPKHRDWTFNTYLRAQATKEQLTQLLDGRQTPALLFTASHGMGFALESTRQLAHQGALLCQDWPGPQQWQKAIPQDFYFAGDDLTGSANLLGLIAFFFACYGAGTPDYDDFSQQAFKERQLIAPYPFLAQLPTRMLGTPKGGALAVIGHVERAWGYSFAWPDVHGPQTTVFESMLQRLLTGHPVGSALEYFNERYAELSTVLGDELEEIEFGKKYDPDRLASMWTANNDARGYAILGDPAVRLPVADAGEAALERALIHLASAAGVGTALAASAPERETATPSGAAAAFPKTVDFSAESAADAETDLNTVIVSTYVAAEADDPHSRTLIACTKLVLDGESETTIYDPVASEQMLILHQQTVAQAVTARLAYLRQRA